MTLTDLELASLITAATLAIQNETEGQWTDEEFLALESGRDRLEQEELDRAKVNTKKARPSKRKK